MPSEPEVGDKVSWNWGGGAPGGTVAEKKTEGEVAITSKRGNKIKKNAEKSDPAVHVERSGNDVVKKASELNVEQKNAKGKSGGSDKKEDKKDDKKDDKKRKHEDEDKKEDKEKDEPLVKNDDGKDVKPGGKDANKKQKKEKDEKKDDKQEEKKVDKKPANGEKKKGGRPKKSESEAKEKKEKKATPRQEGDLVSSRTRSRKQ